MTEVHRVEDWREFAGSIAVFAGHPPERYVFTRIDGKGEPTDSGVLYVGDTAPNNYPKEQSLEDVPDDVIQEVRNRGYDLLTGVESGWENWGGRPEWSDTYVDASEAEIV